MLVFHTLFTFSRSSLLLRPGPLRSLLSSGYVGVNLFFVLSGFILAYVYVDAENGRLKTTPLRFWRARFARIYPMHLLGVLLAFPLFALGSSANRVASALIAREGTTELTLSALLVQAWVPSHALDLNGPSWSLSVEAFFYAAFPLLARLLGGLRARGLVATAAVAWVAAVTPPLLHHGPASAIARTTDLDLVLLYNPLVRLPDFVIGVTAGLLFLRAPRPWSRAPVVATATFLLVLALLAEGDRLPFLLLHNGLLDPLWALLVFALASLGAPRDQRGLGGDAFVRGGRASYSLYVLHNPLYFWGARLFGIGLLPADWFIAAYVAASVARALAARRFVEEPLRRVLTPGGRGRW